MCIPQYCISNRHRAGFAVLSEKLGCLTPFNCSLPRLPLSTLKGCQKRPTTVSKRDLLQCQKRPTTVPRLPLSTLKGWETGKRIRKKRGQDPTLQTLPSIIVSDVFVVFLYMYSEVEVEDVELCCRQGGGGGGGGGRT